jgi:competence ComEA-like helix-hairpin-helix protein
MIDRHFTKKFFVVSVLLTVVVSLSCEPNVQRDPPAPTTTYQADDNAININTASAAELQTLPFIGEKLAQGIVDFRESNGPFRRPEQLMLVPGISEKRYRQIRRMIRVQ